MKKIITAVMLLSIANTLVAQLSTTLFSQQCAAMGLQFSPALIEENFKTITLDTSVAKQYDYAIASGDGKIEYRYRLVATVKDSANATFIINYLLYESAKIKTGYPEIVIKPYSRQTAAQAYNASGGYTAAFKTGDFMCSGFLSCSCFAFYKEGKGLFIIYMLTDDTKILLQEKYADGLVGLLSFK